MTAAERDEKVEALTAQSNAIRDEIKKNTEAARALNEANRTLIEKRREVEKALHALRHVKVSE